ncbi:hypothetical protein [Azospirillum largimobile]
MRVLPLCSTGGPPGGSVPLSGTPWSVCLTAHAAEWTFYRPKRWDTRQSRGLERDDLRFADKGALRLYRIGRIPITPADPHKHRFEW